MIPSNTVTHSLSEISAIVDAVMLKLVVAEMFISRLPIRIEQNRRGTRDSMKP